MWNKIIGGALIVAVIGTIIFSFKFIPLYLGANELERNFNECLSNYKMYREKGCKDLFRGTIDRNNLSLDVEEIRMDLKVNENSTISVEWVEELDFFGIYTYTHTFVVEHEGRVPDRD